MLIRTTFWTVLAALAVAAPVAVNSAAASQEEHAQKDEKHGHEEHATAMTGSTDSARSQAVRVLLLQAHLRTGKALYDAGEREAAVQHFKHFVAELKGTVGHELAERGFERDHVLEEAEDALVDAVVEDQPRPVVVSVYRHTMFEMDRQLNKVGSMRLRDPEFVLSVSGNLLDRASRHYATAVSGERLSQPGEYRYARSIARVARNFVGRVSADLHAKDQQAFERLVQAFNRLNDTMADSQPSGAPATAGTLRERVGEVQLAARDL